VSTTVSYEVTGDVALVTLDRPDARNAIDLALATDLIAAYQRLDADDRVAVGVLAGAGSSFCAGLDLRAVLSGEIDPAATTLLDELFRTTPAKPLVAAVEGFALGGGFELLLNADLLVAASNARFGLPEVRRGLVAAGGALVHLGRRIPFHQAMDLLLTGRQVGAPELHSLGLVSTVTEPGAALRIAVEQASHIAGNAPLALAATKRVLRAAAAGTEADARRVQQELTPGIFSSADAAEGALAFVERRSPRWRAM